MRLFCGRLVGPVDVFAQFVRLAERFVTDSTGVVMERNVLGDTGCRFELRVAGRASVAHCISNSRLDT